MAEVLSDFGSYGASSFPKWVDQRQRLRAIIGQLIGAEGCEIGYVGNTTSGILQAAWSIDWQEGEGLILYEGEFPTNITPWQQVAREYNLTISWINARDAYCTVEKVLAETEQALRRGVRLLAISAVQFQTGFAFPLEQIGQLCKQYNTLFFVDGIQAVGAIPIDVKRSRIDFLSCGSHKWLMGLEGCGFLYINQEIRSRLKPRLTGWLSHKDGLEFLFEGAGRLRYDRAFQSDASFVEGGSLNTIGFAVLEKNLNLLLSLQITNIAAYINHFFDVLEPQLLELGYTSLRHAEYRSGILSLLPPDHCDGKQLAEDLALRGVACSYPDGKIRISPHWPNHLNEIPMIVEAFRQLSSIR